MKPITDSLLGHHTSAALGRPSGEEYPGPRRGDCAEPGGAGPGREMVARLGQNHPEIASRGDDGEAGNQAYRTGHRQSGLGRVGRAVWGTQSGQQAEVGIGGQSGAERGAMASRSPTTGPSVPDGSMSSNTGLGPRPKTHRRAHGGWRRFEGPAGSEDWGFPCTIPLLFFCNRVRGGGIAESGPGVLQSPFHQVPHSSVLIPEYSVPTVTNGNNGRGRERPPLDALSWSWVWAPGVPPPFPGGGIAPVRFIPAGRLGFGPRRDAGNAGTGSEIGVVSARVSGRGIAE